MRDAEPVGLPQHVAVLLTDAVGVGNVLPERVGYSDGVVLTEPVSVGQPDADAYDYVDPFAHAELEPLAVADGLCDRNRFDLGH